MTSFNERVWKKMRKIPRGRVTTYKQLARALNTRAYRAVGNACRHNPYAPEVPCHRVVKTDGTIGGFGGKMRGKNIKRKAALLKKEGVRIKDGKVVDFEKKLYKFK
jgi:methylated-DNA-[protein]-cysteine S-methyltransferase